MELVASGHEVIALFPPDEAKVELEQLGVRCVVLSLSAHSLNPLRELLALTELAGHLRRIQPDIVFAFTIKPIVYSGLCLRGKSNVRFCAMITGLGMMFAGVGVKGWVARTIATSLYRVALAKADVVFMQNKEHRDAFLRRDLIQESQCQLVAGSGVNLQLFSEQPVPVSTENQPPVFLLATRMLEYKGVREYVSAAEAFCMSNGKGEFLLAGPLVEGPHAISRDELTQILADSPVDYVGSVADVRQLLAKASVVVLPSVYPEGVPRILLEALAVGRPIITTDTPGCRATIDAVVAAECNKTTSNRVEYRDSLCVDSEAAVAEPVADWLDSSAGEVGSNGVLYTPGGAHDRVRVDAGPVAVNNNSNNDNDKNKNRNSAGVAALTDCMLWMAALPQSRLQAMGHTSRRLAERCYDVRAVNRLVLSCLLADNDR